VTREQVAPLARPKVLLVGAPSARPAGLERALTRAGFQLVELEDPSVDPDADAILVALNDINDKLLCDLLPDPVRGSDVPPPRIVITAVPDRDAPAAALSLGAADAMTAPVHLPELCSRIHARIRNRRAVLAPRHSLPGALNGSNPGGQPREVWDESFPALERRMLEEFERARRYSLSFSLILLGLDELNGVRDRLGPAAADRLKGNVADILRRELRLPDFVGSYGSNEFAVVLPETGSTGARESVIRLRQRLALVPQAGDIRLNAPQISAGIVTCPHPAVSESDELYAMAEAALMRGQAQSGVRIGMAL